MHLPINERFTSVQKDDLKAALGKVVNEGETRETAAYVAKCLRDELGGYMLTETQVNNIVDTITGAIFEYGPASPDFAKDMSDAQAPRPSLAELRAAHSSIVRDDIPHVPCMDPSCTKTRGEHPKPLRDIYDALPALLEIAEAAQAVAHEAEFYADDDTPDDSLIVVPRADMKKLDEALAKVRP